MNTYVVQNNKSSTAFYSVLLYYLLWLPAALFHHQPDFLLFHARLADLRKELCDQKIFTIMSACQALNRCLDQIDQQGANFMRVNLMLNSPYSIKTTVTALTQVEHKVEHKV